MLKHFDHVTVAVTDPAAAIGFFALLGFELDKDVVIKGPVMDQYLGIAGLEARHRPGDDRHRSEQHRVDDQDLGEEGPPAHRPSLGAPRAPASS